jgi:hypothetical protein
MVRTAVENHTQNVAPTLLLVVQTEQYDAIGMSEWNVTIWRLAVLPQKTGNSSVAKSI